MVSTDDLTLPGTHDVEIAPNCIGMPLGRILLIRKDEDYCAVRFTQNWTAKTHYKPGYEHEAQHAEYESYYQGDKTGNFNNKNVKYRKEEVYYKPIIYIPIPIFGHPIAIGAKVDIRCGGIELWWSAGPHLTFVYFNRHDQSQRDYGIELAPTKWTDISQVNVFDSRIKWYRYDEKRKDIIIPVDQLWENKENKK